MLKTKGELEAEKKKSQAQESELKALKSQLEASGQQ
jgi:hypothetical protein